MTESKQVILLRKDLKLPLGKACTQVAHASVEATLKSTQEKIKAWRISGMKKVVLSINSEKDLFNYNQMAKDMGLKTALIIDAGKTVVKPGTKTCLAIGPDQETKIDKLTSKLKLIS